MSYFTKFSVFSLLVISLATLSACRTPGPGTPLFPYSNGWIGADGAYSVEIAPGKSVWLFGDSFVNALPGATSRIGSKFVHNSIGVSQCDSNQNCVMNYYWGNQGTTTPKAFFTPSDSSYYYWPLDGFTNGGSLYYALYRIKPGTGSWSWTILGTTLAKVLNPLDPPSQWQITYQDLSGPDLYPGVSIAVNNGYAFFFTLKAGTARDMTLARVSLNHLDSVASHFQRLNKWGIWKDGLDASRSKTLFSGAANEMTVKYHPSSNQWVAVYSDTNLANKKILMRRSFGLAGVWQLIPRTAHIISDSTNQGFCYAGKEHPEFSRNSKDLILTYVCNSSDNYTLMHDLNSYTPRVAVESL